MPIFGRFIKKNVHNVLFQHWSRTIPSSTMTNTPNSAPLILKECDGCSLHKSSAALPPICGQRRDPSLASYPCLKALPHDNVVDLSSYQIGRQSYTRIDRHTLRTTFAQVTSNIRQSLGIAPPTLTTFLAPQISGNFTLSPVFSHNQLPINLPAHTRSFLRDLFDAVNFDSLLKLSRWSRISFFHQRQLIDWDNTWLLLNIHHSTKRGRTSF